MLLDGWYEGIRVKILAVISKGLCFGTTGGNIEVSNWQVKVLLNWCTCGVCCVF